MTPKNEKPTSGEAGLGGYFRYAKPHVVLTMIIRICEIMDKLSIFLNIFLIKKSSRLRLVLYFLNYAKLARESGVNN